MRTTLARVSTLLLAMGILLVGHGLQLTLLPLYARFLGWSAEAIALTGSSYFLGFVIGCMSIPRVVASVGHIRTHNVLGALATVALLAAGLIPEWGAWMVLRFVTGFALSGIYMVVESWLSESASATGRGSVLAVYSVISLMGMAAGQGLLTLVPAVGLEPFVYGALLLSLSIIPVGLTPVPAPRPLPAIRFRLVSLGRNSRVALVATLFSGMVTGAFWTVGPLVGSAYGLDSGQVGLMMSAGIFGGALVQLPLGRLSDRMDRRRVIAGVLFCGSVFGVAGWLFAGTSMPVLLAIMFLIGATTIPIYALSIAHGSDNTELTLVEVASGILIMNSLGSIVGPIAVAWGITHFGASSFFVLTVVGLLTPACWTLWRIRSVGRPAEHDHRFENLPRTTQVVADMPLSDGAPAADPETAGAGDGRDDFR